MVICMEVIRERQQRDRESDDDASLRHANGSMNDRHVYLNLLTMAAIAENVSLGVAAFSI